MPLEKLIDNIESAWAIWKITESETQLSDKINSIDRVPESVTNPFKRLEYLAGRVVIKKLLENWSLQYEGLVKDEFGKPYLKNFSFHISLSHSYPYVAAVINQKFAVGIDLEQPKEKLLRIGPRVLNQQELQDAGIDIVKHCIYWCSKEALIKIYGKKDLMLAKNLAIEPFSIQKQGSITGRIIVGSNETLVKLNYHVSDNFVVVHN
ncbi:4'-phosphopantetheinyl transferase family protein [Chryseosolibacter indicus]|uniref:4'-phosphopantetheinyl transferase superfamily protein n=1 Tax=Chryseosolibacter indicus TaxID=2782351 RepID=A0ABS5VSR6_9BACT|nr:4'-phosphopantetheinyl transferase superfamily protein [Chryseosolibacter indicus]MBT1703880.1 4'-phosphopantetheinyl transferase superfamily protein [Chryseosolibacter indicus]